MRLALLALASVAVSALAVTPVQAQVRSADIVSWTASVETSGRGQAEVVLRAQIREGWRLYAMGSPVGRPLTVAFDPLPEGLTATGPIRQSTPREDFDKGLGLDYTYFAQSATLRQPLRVDTRARGRQTLSGTVRFSVCDDSVCLPPAAVEFGASLNVGRR